MASDKGRPLPKFGEWDVNNPASAEGFTVIFNKARDEKKTKNATAKITSPKRNDAVQNNNDSYQNPPKWKWLCCG
ncbi:protein NOI4 [Hevea brasiliensis]|uniref:protein NOI4 n=1 Tax=Hevea brasiliensis TaxID=3981 RepID=UPI000B785140|nr:protein NOI4 [Hevea brasiliensis]